MEGTDHGQPTKNAAPWTDAKSGSHNLRSKEPPRRMHGFPKNQTPRGPQGSSRTVATTSISIQKLPHLPGLDDRFASVLVDVFPFRPKTFTSSLFLECQVGIWKGL